ncbi:MAG: M6 family metalloprotease domain-containing protein [Bacteroidales bacterium]|nr:M6 family metalloprotease domain-containing protein [Bacteroidales bacterium]
MKKFLAIVMLFSGLLFGFSQRAYAVKAYPYPIQVRQPDGSVITIRKHGDEFLNWTTSSGRLVKQGTDGFYYLATFSSQGIVQATTTRVQSVFAPQGISTVTPPPVAFERAMARRKDFAKTFSGRTPASRLNVTASAVPVSSGAISSGRKNFLVILVQFSDLSFTIANPQSEFFNLLNQDGYAVNGATGSAWNYFHENSSNTFDPQFDVVGPVTLSRPVSYYGANDEEENSIYELAREMVVEAVDLADQLGVDFSQYDNDGDGYIDNIFVFFAGHNEAEGGPDDTIWPHASSIYNQKTVDGVKTGRYACTSELRGSSGSTIAGVGTFCHEFGHVLGLPDFYDTDYEENGLARGLGSFSLMSYGNYNNYGRTPPYLTSIERDMLGWLDLDNEAEVIEQEGDYSLGPVSENACYVSKTTNAGEFFLYEYRKNAGWDAFVPSGLLIYHIDKSDNLVGGKTAAARWNDWDGINAYASHQCCDLIEAVYPESAVQHEDQVPFPGSTNNTSFTDTSTPAAIDFAGYPTGIYLTNIADNGNQASFTISKNNILLITGCVSDSEGSPIAGAVVTLSFEEPSATRTSREERTSVTTGVEGTYVFETSCRVGTYYLEVIKEGFYSAYDQVDASHSGTFIANFTLIPIGEGTLKKHGTWEGYCIGYGSPGGTIYGAVGFSAQELASYEGSSIASMSILVAGTTATEVGVFITVGNETVFSNALTNPSFRTLMQVDLSPYGLIIPGGKDMKFGYYVIDSDNGYPLATDNGPMAPMGGYVGTDIASLTGTWKELYNIDVNIQISAVVEKADNQLFSLGYYMIPYTGRTYYAGDTYTFKLNDDPTLEGVERPESTTWFFNDQPYNTGDVVSLVPGNHKVKAVLTFTNRTQAIIYEIHCKNTPTQSTRK